MLAELRSRSQITIPAEIIKHLGISEGDKFEVMEKDGGIFLCPVVIYPKEKLMALAQLLKKADGSGRVAALEVLFANNAVRNLIRESKTYQIPSVMQTNKRGGMQTMDDALYDLFMRKVIDADTAVTYAQEPVSMNRKVNLDVGSGFDTGFDGGFHAGFDGQMF